MAITEDEISDAGEAPLRVKTDEGYIEERPIHELVRADQYSNTKGAGDAVPWGIRCARIKPGGSVV